MLVLFVLIIFTFSFGNAIAEEFLDDDFLIVPFGIIDITPPELTGVELSSSEVEVPGVIEVILTGQDDESGLDYGWLTYKNSVTNKIIGISVKSDRIYDENKGGYVEVPAGQMIGILKLDQYQYPGSYELINVSLYDKADNSQIYFKDSEEFPPEYGYKELLISSSFTVINENFKDTTPPELTGVELSLNEVEVPGVIEVMVTGQDDKSGLKSGWLRYKNQETGKEIVFWIGRDGIYDAEGALIDVPEGKLLGTLKIDQYQNPGLYELSNAELYDRADNRQIYYKDIEDYQLEYGHKELPISSSFLVINDGENYELTTNTANPNLVTDIENVAAPADDQPPVRIGINYETGSTVPKEVFTAISGENKEIVFEGGGLQWVFNGKDIQNENLKGIDLNVNINNLNNFYEGNANEIKDQVKNKPTYVLSFPENGVLPGKAKIRLKVDYEFTKHLGSQDLTVYFFDNVKKELILVKANVNVSADGFIEFEIDHNSDFLIVNEKAGNGSEGSGGSSSGGGGGGGGAIIKPPTNTSLETIKGLSQKDKETIVKNLNEKMPYTSKDGFLNEELLMKLTNNKFTKKELEEILKDESLLKELGLEKLLASVKTGLNPIKNPSFNDIDSQHWAYELVVKGAEKGFIAGMPDGGFKPEDALQVADTFTFLDRVLLQRNINEMKLSRSTVEKYITDKEHWAFNNMASIASKLSENTLKTVANLGEKPITREILAQTLFEITDGKIKESKERIDFSDTGNSPYKEALEYCVRTGLLVGTGETTMSPEKVLTRAELIVILNRLDDLLK